MQFGEEQFDFSSDRGTGQGATSPPLKLLVTVNYAKSHIALHWSTIETGEFQGEIQVSCSAIDELTWELTLSTGKPSRFVSLTHRTSIRARLKRLSIIFPTSENHVRAQVILWERKGDEFIVHPPKPATRPATPLWVWIEAEIANMVQNLRPKFAALEAQIDDARVSQNEREALLDDVPEVDRTIAEVFLDWADRREAKQEDRARREAARLAEARAQVEAKRRRRFENQQKREALRRQRELNKSTPAPRLAVSGRPAAPLPPVPMSIELPGLEIQQTLLPATSLSDYFLRERAALWWVSNQADDLLSLPHCRIQRLEYQIRTALRVIGPLRGRALLSDEVGLGKTIEAGLVLKEYLTRGMVKRFLVLTVPSLVDQWEEELEDKFNLKTATTNHALFRADPSAFWRTEKAVVASLHTLKQPAHAAVAQAVHWDLLVVDEAHHLRNQTSQAWQTVNGLPRQFLLLLTATPVQNSLDELYNLVTLLQPGQLPSPREFRARFIDKSKPHQPREPEELRRILGQVMIRNTRANAGINLPPRRAETVLFESSDSERAFWQQWETELRQKLAGMAASHAALRGRILLQSAGSSPAAWRSALASFPDQTVARTWSNQAPIEPSWLKKCQSILPLTKGDGGVVIFTQFLHTQEALAAELQKAGAPVFVINGSIPASERQPITEQFQKLGGALLLTQSGTEGRNLQFSHRLVNFDLPWNPMEIEQRIGRLHRLGQQHQVRIYNLVQAGTLQEHLLQILQEKLNLFELVVGETGLVLGERFSGDEFAEEVFRRWRDSEGRVAEAMQSLGEELAAARRGYDEVRQLDDTLFAHDYESL